jgi:tetratricopeptide (TPR) repeat protein
MTTAGCPDRAELALLLTERLAGPEAERVEAHVEACARCQGVLTDLCGHGATGEDTPPIPAPPAPHDEPRPEFVLRLRGLLRAAGGAPRRDLYLPGESSARGAPEDARTYVQSDTTAPGLSLGDQPERVGRYILLGEVARGGVGVVYRALDAGIGRDIAIKLLQPRHRHSPDAVRRFADEARITGRLQHPGVPPVFEVGDDPNSGPYMAMKLVEGRTLADHLGAGPAPDLVPAFERVCQAVAYAHAQGVIHRDLKPSNVMVGAFGEVQVMDWGLAKVLADRAGAEAAGGGGTGLPAPPGGLGDATGTGSVLGTPAYMPPEQAVGELGRVDERSDVFGLGGILCVVLTGRPPYVGDSADSTWRMAARGRLDEAFARLDGCGADPELAAVCKGCLAADPTDRPRDAGAVARAVAGLRAAAEDRARRAELDRAEARVRAAEERKRRRAQLWLGAAVAAVLLAGGGLAGWQWWRAEGALDRVTEEKRGKEAALEQKTVALADAEDARSRTLTALRALTDQLVGEQFGRQAGLTDRDRAFFRDVARLWGEAAAARRGGPEAAALRAEGSYRVGRILDRLGEWTDAEQAYRDAVTGYEALTDAHPDDPGYRSGLATAYTFLGMLLKDQARLDESERALRDAVAGYRKLVADHRDTPAYRAGLGRAHNSLGVLMSDRSRPADAEQSFKDSLAVRGALAATHRDVPDYQNDVTLTSCNLATVYIQTRRFDAAEKMYREAADVQKRLVADHADVPDYRRVLAHTLYSLGVLMTGLNRLADGERAYRDATAEFEKLTAANSGVPEYRHMLAHSHTGLGVTLEEKGQLDDAERAYREAAAARERLVAAHGEVTEYRTGLATTLTVLARLRSRRQDFASARDLLAQARPHLLAAYGANQNDPVCRQLYSRHLHVGCEVHLRLGDHAAAAAAAGELANLGFGPVTNRYDAARYLARCIPLAEREGTLFGPARYLLAQHYGDRAVVCLRRAIDGGWKDAARLRTDADLDPLRGRADFRRVLDELAARAAPPALAPPPRSRPAH